MAATILMIEDYSAHRALLSSVISQMGCRALEAADGRSGFEMAVRHDPALIILDLILPDMDGLEVLARLRAEPTCQYTPVLIVSAVDDHERVIKALSAGADDYLTKPFDAAVLQARMKVLLRAARLHHVLAEGARSAEVAGHLARAAVSGDLAEACAEVAGILCLPEAFSAARLFVVQDEAAVGPYGPGQSGETWYPLAGLARQPLLGKMLCGESAVQRAQRADLGPLGDGLETTDAVIVALRQAGRTLGLVVLSPEPESVREAHLRRLQEVAEPAALAVSAAVDRHRRRISESRYRTLFEHAADGLAILDPRDGGIREVNHALAHRLAVLPSGLYGKPFGELFDPATADRLQRTIGQWSGDPTPTSGQLRLPDGRSAAVQILLRRVRHGQGSDLIALIRSAEPVTAETATLRETGRAIRHLNHEINNPLACIVGLTQLLQLRLRDRPEQQAHLATILESSERISNLLHELRELAFRIGGDEPLDAEMPMLDAAFGREETGASV